MDNDQSGLSLQPGTTLDRGKYKIVRLLGRGGMGAVYLAEQVRTHKRVAIKAVHSRHAHGPGAAERLVREAQAAARVPHPNVVDVYDVIAEGEAVYLVMEYLEGETLGHYLANRELAPHRVIALLLPAMRAVAAAHKHGVVHRDLKPDNIFLQSVPDSTLPIPKVLDFGISKLEARETDLVSLTASGHILGTPAYMSLEQLSAVDDIDGRADVYAFGVILYEALTRRMPYEAQTLTELIFKITTTTPPSIKSLRPELPSALDAIVRWAMAKERHERIASMEALILELEPLSTSSGFASQLTETSREVPAPVSPILPRTSEPQVPATKPARAVQRSLAWLGAALVMAVGVIAIARGFSGQSSIIPASVPPTPTRTEAPSGVDAPPRPESPMDSASPAPGDTTAAVAVGAINEGASAPLAGRPSSHAPTATRPTQTPARSTKSSTTRAVRPARLGPEQQTSVKELQPSAAPPLPAASAAVGSPKDEAPKSPARPFRVGNAPSADQF